MWAFCGLWGVLIVFGVCGCVLIQVGIAGVVVVICWFSDFVEGLTLVRWIRCGLVFGLAFVGFLVGFVGFGVSVTFRPVWV